MDLNCDICCEGYNINDRKPMTVIPCGHTFCLNCLEELKKCEYMCPNDRERITNEKPNYALLNLLNAKRSSFKSIENFVKLLVIKIN